jgi:hypothetical protein
VNNGFYGGASASDNSGRIRYVQVRFPGFEVAPGNELNGITLAGVGRGTTIDHIQVHNSSDDGIEWFGGTVNQSHIAITGADDDSIDTDLGFKGFIQFAYVHQRTTGGDRIIEADSPGNEDANPRQNTRLANFTFVSNRTADPILLRGGTDFTLINGVVRGGGTCLDIDGNATVQAANNAIDEVGPPIFRSVLFQCPTAARDEADVPLASITPLITGNNNVLNAVSSLLALFTGGPLGLPGANETGATSTNPTGFNTAAQGNFFTAANYVGAFSSATDTWFQGWTCGLQTGSSCATAPANTGT